MISKFIKRYSWPVIIFMLMVIPGSMAIFASDTTLTTKVDSLTIVRVGITYVLLLCMLASMMHRTVKDNQMQFLGIAFIWWFIGVAHVAPEVKTQWNILALLILIAYSYFRPDEREKVFALYRYYIIIMCGCGIVAFLAFMLKLPLPCDVVPYYTGQEIKRHVYVWGFYYNYYIGWLWGADGFGRLCGWFNEPGYLGTIASLILIAENMNMRRKGNIVILVATVFTFSLAAFIIILGYLLTMSLRKGKMVVGLACFLIFCTTVIPFVFEGNEVYDRFVERLEVKDGEFKGDNRANNKIFKRLQQQQFEEWGPMLFGYGSGALDKYGNLGILSLKVQLYLYGIVGIALTYGLLLLYALKLARGSYQAKCFVIWFFLSSYQRPYIFAIDYILILFGGIAFIKSHYPPNRIDEPVEKFGVDEEAYIDEIDEADSTSHRLT